MKEKINGKGAVGLAIAYYSLNGMVSIPLEPCSYNLLYDDGIRINKIKVASTSYKTPYGNFRCNIRSMGGNFPNMKCKLFDPNCCDYVFVVTSELELYSIPSTSITSTRAISMNMFGIYKVKLV